MKTSTLQDDKIVGTSNVAIATPTAATQDAKTLMQSGKSPAVDQAPASAPTLPIGESLPWPFFRNYPVYDYFRSSKGLIPKPFPVVANASIIYFLAPYDLVAQRMEGTGLKPVRVGADCAVGQLWLMNYTETGIGPYQEAALSYPASKEEKFVEQRNAYSVFAPALDPSNVIFCDKLVLNDDLAVAGGREWAAFDKSKAQSELVVKPGVSTQFSFADESGAAIVSGKVKQGGFFTKVKGILGLTKAIGWGATLKLAAATVKQLLTKSSAPLVIVNRELNNLAQTRTVVMQTLVDPTLRILDQKDQLTVGAAGPFAEALKAVQPKFIGVASAKNLCATFDLQG